jgi:hypothetical protein
LLSVLASVFLGFQISHLHTTNQELQNRVNLLDAAVRKRQVADPLEPVECGPGFGNGTGKSSGQPCRISIWRLLTSPQQFDGKWVRVQGAYRSGFEQSALYDVDYQLAPSLSEVFMQPRFALWVDTSQQIDASLPRRTFIGLYRRGPSGHLSQYGGRLESAVVVR